MIRAIRNDNYVMLMVLFFVYWNNIGVLHSVGNSPNCILKLMILVSVLDIPGRQMKVWEFYCCSVVWIIANVVSLKFEFCLRTGNGWLVSLILAWLTKYWLIKFAFCNASEMTWSPSINWSRIIFIECGFNKGPPFLWA